ncbi:Beta-glucoside kinase [Aerococcus viridans]|uniref:NagC family transcriptional regulator n=2 Tax=Aerococcus viridans TaxID=1377 RepID=A0AAU8U8A0_9LACT|nr:ROK family protein [Aerococcus viridans]AMC01803.1 NagC family transcriptional regulator [Aerococcus viridans]EFG49136.1 ROK family protein [Aerococcus viridans ATCC 11563 = CCUG 4311]SUU12299.1 Beta-glucoside kinase [Aerococcus viridans]
MGDQLKGVGFSAPGQVISETGVVHVGGAIPFIDGLNFKHFIKENFALPAVAINDGKAAAQAELWQGHLTDVKNGLVLLIGTGVGGGIVLNGQLHQGSHFQAGELFYMYASSNDMTTENAMGRRGSAVISINKSRALLGLAPGDGEEVFQALEEGDNPEVTALFEQYCQDIVYIIHTLQISLDLDRVIFGGGISAQPLLLEGIQNKYNEIRDHVEWFKNSFEPIEIGLCKYGSEANLIGAVYQLLIEE